MRQGLALALLWWIVSFDGGTLAYLGPYPDGDVCKAAKAGAVAEHQWVECMPEQHIDSYLELQHFMFQLGEGRDT